MKLWPITVLLSNLAQGQNYNGLNCSPDNWQTHMPNFVKEFNKQKRLRAKLKLYGGSTASEKKFNWVVQISEIGYRQGHCTGAIINADWILTAAHCFWKEDMPNVIDYEHVTTTYDVKLGHDTRLQRQSFKISEIFHPEEAYSDIVLIRLEKSIDFATTKAGVVCLPSENWNKYEEQNYYDTKCYAAGFGYRNNREKSNNLQEATFPVTSCRIYQSFIRDEFGTEKILCSRQNHKGSHALCQGDSGGPLFCLHQDQPMLVGVARTSTGCESQPNYGHATFTNVAWWNKWMRQVIEKRDSTIHCLEPFEIIKVDKNSTNFARIVKVSDQYLHLRLNQTNSFNENDPETKKIFQCKTQCERTAGCVKFILVGGLDCLIIYGRGQVHQTPKTITLHSLLGTSVESFWVGTLDDEHGDYGRCGLRKTPPKPFIFVSKKVLIQSTPLQSTNAAAVTNTWTKYKRQFNQKFASSFRYRLTGGPLNSFEVELYLAMRTLSTAYPLATDGDGLIRGLIREIFGKENVIQSDNEVAYAKLFNVQRTAEFCDLSTMNGMFRKALVSLSLCLFWTTPKVYYKCKLIVQHIYFIHDKNSSNVRFKNLNF